MRYRSIVHTAQRAALVIGLVAFLPWAGRANGQQVQLLRDVPGVWDGCDAVQPVEPSRSTLAQRQEAERLAAAATQSAILGDNAAALDLLRRAALLDPASADIAYHLARTLQELGRSADALAAYCRYAGLAGDAPDIADVYDRIRTISVATVTTAAARAFEIGIVHFEGRRLREAEAAFGQAMAAAPAWNAPVYNRAVVRAALNRRDAAAGDLQRYLELAGDPARASALAAVVGAAPAAGPRSYNPAGALVAGLIVPGLGHFTTDRPLIGALVMGTAAGAVAVGLASQRLKVDCLSPPVDGRCPPEDVLRERTERPYLLPAIGVAAAAGLIGAIDAYSGARRRNGQPAGSARTGAGAVADGAILALSRVQPGPDGVRVELLRLRF